MSKCYVLIVKQFSTVLAYNSKCQLVLYLLLVLHDYYQLLSIINLGLSNVQL